MDAALLIWLAEDADWAPVELVLEGDVDQLVSAGYDRDDLIGFREAYTAATEAEADEPGTLTGSQAGALVATARALAGDVNRYPSVAEVGREVFYNEFSPFYKAPILYGLAFALLGVSLMLGAVQGRRREGRPRRALRARDARARRRDRHGGLRLRAPDHDLGLGPGDEHV